MNTQAEQIINRLGGTTSVSRLFGIRKPSVSDWKKNGIPRARMMFLQVARPDVVRDIDVPTATAPAYLRGTAKPTTPTPTKKGA